MSDPFCLAPPEPERSMYEQAALLRHELTTLREGAIGIEKPAHKTEPATDSNLLALIVASTETLRALVALQREDRAARLQADELLRKEQQLNQLRQSEYLALQEATEARLAACILEAEKTKTASVFQIDEQERKLSASVRALAALSHCHDALAQRQEVQAGTYLAEIEGLRARIAQFDEGVRISPVLRRHARFARHIVHPLIDGMMLAATGPSNSPVLILDAPMITRTNFQPLFAPSPNGEYQLSDFLALHDRSFVRAAYLAILRREPDADGAENYLLQVRSGEHKAKLLSHFLSSKEGSQFDTKIHGLREHMRVIQICELPIVGRLVSAMFFLAHVNGHLRDLRVLENHVIRIAEESQAIHEANMSKLRSVAK